MSCRAAMRVRGRYVALSLAIFFIKLSLCFGQDKQPDLADLSLEQLGEIKVYSASKHVQSTAQAPASVTVITSEDIQEHGYRTLADILRSVRSFYVSSDRNYSYLGVRGYGRPGDYNGRVLLMIDGHRINDNIYDQATPGTELPLDVDLIERVELVRGPSSSLYGSNAFFGVINIITKTANELNGWELSFEPGSFETYKGRASYGGNFKGADFVLSGTFFDSVGPKLFFPAYNSPDTNYGIVQDGDYDRYHDLLLTTTFRHLTLQVVDDWREKGIPTAPYSTGFGDTRTRSLDAHQYVDIRYQDSFAHWNLDARTYYDGYRYRALWAYPELVNVDYARGQRWGSDVQLSRSFAQKHHLTFGGELRDNFQQDQKNYDVAPAYVYFSDQRSSWMGAAFVQDEYAITPRLLLNAGIRYDHYTRYGGSGNPRLALLYHPFESTSLKFLYGTAFRVPNVYEAYYGTGSASTLGFLYNPRLSPESMQNIEGVWEQNITSTIQISTGVFRTYLKDLISLQEDADTGELIYRNTDEARSTGAEFEVNARFHNNIKGRLSYTYTEAEDEKTNQILPNSPRHMVKLDLVAPLYKQALSIGADAQYVDARRSPMGEVASAYPIFNMTLLGHTWKKHLDISGSIYNLLDRHYFDVGSDETQQQVVQQNGRTFRIKLVWHWGGK